MTQESGEEEISTANKSGKWLLEGRELASGSASPCCSLTLPLILKPSSHSQSQKCSGPKLHCLLALFPPPIPAVLLEEGAGFPPAASCSENASSSTATRNFLASTGSWQGTEAGVQRLICTCQASWRGFSCEQGRVNPRGGEEVVLLLIAVLRGRNPVNHFVFG